MQNPRTSSNISTKFAFRLRLIRHVFWVTAISLVLLACSISSLPAVPNIPFLNPGSTETADGTTSQFPAATGDLGKAARTAFESYTKRIAVQYQNESFQVVQNDGSLATVLVTASFRQTSNAGWQEQESRIQCQKANNTWTCSSQLTFQLSAASATATSAALKASATATTQALEAQCKGLATKIKLQAPSEIKYDNSQNSIAGIHFQVAITNEDDQIHKIEVSWEIFLNPPETPFAKVSDSFVVDLPPHQRTVYTVNSPSHTGYVITSQEITFSIERIDAISYTYSEPIKNIRRGQLVQPPIACQVSGSTIALRPTRTTSYLVDIRMLSASEGWITTTESFLLHFTKGRWEEVPGPTTSSNIVSMNPVSPDDAWAVDGQGIIWHYKAGTWQNVSGASRYTMEHMSKVYMVSPQEWWAIGSEVGSGYAIFLHYINGNWISVQPPTNLGSSGAVDMHMISASEGWAVGNGFYTSFTYHYSNSQWSIVQNPAKEGLNRVYMLSANDVWAVGEDGTILHYDGSKWQSVKSPTDQHLYDVQMLSPTSGWAVGSEGFQGTLLQYQNGQWKKLKSPAPNSLLRLQMVSGSEGWVIGDDGILLHYLNGTWDVYE